MSRLTSHDDYIFIYYSGHGVEKGEQAYWIPKYGSKEFGNDDWISINYIDLLIKDLKAHHLIVMVDSCYVGGKFKGVNTIDSLSENNVGLNEEMLLDGLTLRARSVLSSGSNGRVSDTVEGSNHSRFGLSFINSLKAYDKMSKPLTLSEIALNMNDDFAGVWKHKPRLYYPSTWKDLGGQFIFIPKKNIK